MYYNCHIHTFMHVDVPVRFLPLGLVRVLSTKPGFRIISRALNRLNPFSDDDVLDRYVKFLTTSKLGSQQAIFEKCVKFYPEGTRFIILPMDMKHMGAGKVPRDYEDQLKELAELKIRYPEQVIPFFHVDPRRGGVFDLFRRYIEDHGFRGAKLYPPLGYFPYDPKLMQVYRYCEENDLPVLAHGSPYNPVFFKGKKKELLKLLSASLTPIDTDKKNHRELCSNFTHPKNYRIVFEEFKKLRICIAHFGSEYYWDKFIHEPGDPENWFSIIRKMIMEYDNFYADISFTLNKREYFSLLKVILTNEKVRNKVLFGSDYYMVEVETDERRFGLDLRAFIGESFFNDIAVKNPEAFLSER